MSEIGDKVLRYLDDRYGTYRSIAWGIGEPVERVKHACQMLRKEGTIRVDYVQEYGCIRKAVVMMNDGRYMRRDDRALEGAYKMGQTDLDGGMVVDANAEYVRKEKAPWKDRV